MGKKSANTFFSKQCIKCAKAFFSNRSSFPLLRTSSGLKALTKGENAFGTTFQIKQKQVLNSLPLKQNRKHDENLNGHFDFPFSTTYLVQLFCFLFIFGVISVFSCN